MTQRIVVTGGAGYIGSHVCVELLSQNAAVLIVDDFSNSDPKAVARIREVSAKDIALCEGNLAACADTDAVIREICSFKPTSAIHLAGLKAVGESVAEPARYYRNNLGAALTLIRAMEKANAKTIVFSSSATVYGENNPNPVKETGATGPTNPYGRTKLFIEEILKDLPRADDAWRIANLRYFNPVGAHPSGRIGEDPNDIPNNLFPFMAQVAVGKLDKLKIFGVDYPTRDGSGVRDYIHVCDLARGHVAALDYLAAQKKGGAIDINLGAGVGYSVIEAVSAFERAAARKIPYEIAPRRDGDVAEIFADAGLAKKLLGWKAEKTLDDMCADHWRWQKNNPNGYKS